MLDVIEIISVIVGSFIIILMIAVVIVICRSNAKKYAQPVSKVSTSSGVTVSVNNYSNSANVSLLSDLYTAPPVGV